ncbi:hypothetical protein FQN60_015429, partial [Etheostoma spectabile]
MLRHIHDFNILLSSVPGKHFYVHLAGETKGAHHTFVEKLKDVGHTEVQSPGESDYLSVFCPISSRVGTDINEALDHIPAILVVMHHTFDPDHVVAPSRRQVDNPSVLLTVDCLFYERKLLECNRNDIAWHDVQKCLGIPLSQVSTWKQYCRLSGRNFYVHLAGETNGAHQAFVEKLKDGGHTEVQSPGESDYLLVFCPNASRVDADIREALLKIPGRERLQPLLGPFHGLCSDCRQIRYENQIYETDCPHCYLR